MKQSEQWMVAALIGCWMLVFRVENYENYPQYQIKENKKKLLMMLMLWGVCVLDFNCSKIFPFHGNIGSVRLFRDIPTTSYDCYYYYYYLPELYWNIELQTASILTFQDDVPGIGVKIFFFLLLLLSPFLDIPGNIWLESDWNEKE